MRFTQKLSKARFCACILEMWQSKQNKLSKLEIRVQQQHHFRLKTFKPLTLTLSQGAVSKTVDTICFNFASCKPDAATATRWSRKLNILRPLAFRGSNHSDVYFNLFRLSQGLQPVPGESRARHVTEEQ